MFLRAILRTSITAQPRFNIARLSSTTAEAGNAAQDDKPIDMPNPFKKDQIKCILCKNNIEPDYKNVRLLSQFQSPFTGKIYGRHITGLCKRMQEKVEIEIQKSQQSALMGYFHKDPAFLKDPKLFDPERPIRPHKY